MIDEHNIASGSGQTAEELFAPLPEGPFDIIYADPPWLYRNPGLTGYSAEIEPSKQYPCLPVDDIKKLPVKDIAAENSLLFMWVTSPRLYYGEPLGKAWGFKYATIAFIWHKDGHPLRGHYTMTECELCLVFRRGKIPQPRGARNVRQFLSHPRDGHSTKPEEVRRRIDAMFPEQRKIELFARRAAPGWTAWGNQVEKKDAAPLLQPNSTLFQQEAR